MINRVSPKPLRAESANVLRKPTQLLAFLGAASFQVRQVQGKCVHGAQIAASRHRSLEMNDIVKGQYMSQI